MRIDPQALPPALNQPHSTAVTGPAATDGTPTGPGSSTLATSPELQALVSAARTVPEVRTDLVAQVAQRLADGALQTPQALRQTAAAILGT